MKITLESTTKVVKLLARYGAEPVPARVWEGHTANGVPVFAFITRIAPRIPEKDLTPEQDAEFQRDLQLQIQPSPEVQAIDPRLIL